MMAYELQSLFELSERSRAIFSTTCDKGCKMHKRSCLYSLRITTEWRCRMLDGAAKLSARFEARI